MSPLYSIETAPPLVRTLHTDYHTPHETSTESLRFVRIFVVFLPVQLVSHGVNHCHVWSAMVERPLHLGNIAVLCEQIYRIDLSRRMRRDILRQPERDGSAFDVLPYRLTGPVTLRVIFMLENVLFPGNFAHIAQQMLRKPDDSALSGLLLRHPERNCRRIACGRCAPGSPARFPPRPHVKFTRRHRPCGTRTASKDFSSASAAASTHRSGG